MTSECPKNGYGLAPSLTVIIPVFNEVHTVSGLIARVVSAPYLDKQVIVVDDGSTDGTSDQLSAWCGHPGVLVLRHPRNKGKGRAVRTGLLHASGTYTVIQDADMEYDPADYPQLIEPLRAGRADVVYGSRYMRAGNPPGPRLFRLGVRTLNGVARALYGVRLTDEATCYKAIRTAALLDMDLQCEGFEFCPELTAKACRLGLRILEVPISYRPREAAAGKKIRLRDGISAIHTLWRWRRWPDGFAKRLGRPARHKGAPPAARLGTSARVAVRPVPL